MVVVQLLASMRVGALHGGLEHVNEDAVPPCQKLQIVAWKEGRLGQQRLETRN